MIDICFFCIFCYICPSLTFTPILVERNTLRTKNRQKVWSDVHELRDIASVFPYFKG